MDFLKKLKDHIVPSERNVYRPHLLRKPWLIFFVTVILTAEGVYLVNLVARQSAFDFVAAVLPGEVIALTNEERSTNAVGSVTENAMLDAAAQAKADDMAAKGYFSHTGPDGKEPWAWIKEAGYSYQYAGENLAVRFTDSADVVNAWMASPTHRANIVKPAYTEIGVGIAQGEFQGQPATYVVQYFGTPRSAPVAISKTPAAAPVIAIAPAASASANPQVEGVSTQQEPVPQATYTSASTPLPAHADSPWSSVAKSLLQNEANPDASVLWILGAIAAVMIVGLAFTFFVHIQIQPTDMLIGGAVVAVIAVSFLMLNSQSTLAPRSLQSAAVFGALPSQGGFIDSSSASSQAQL